MTQERDFDLVVLGASGFTGQFVVRRLQTSGVYLRWAVAGRSVDKLKQILHRPHVSIPGTIERPQSPTDLVETLRVNVFEEESVREMCRRTRLVLNCVGPFRMYGEPVVKACIENGCDYVDITGEPEFIERIMWEYHEKAKVAGVTIVPACGFDCVPTEMGVLLIKRALEKRNIKPSSIEMFFELHTGKSGLVGHYGTFETAVYSASSVSSLRKLRKLANRPKIPQLGPKLRVHKLPYWEPRVQSFVVPFVFADPSVVRLSQQLVLQGESKEEEPPIPVPFSAYVVVRSPLLLAVILLWALLFSFLVQFRLGRALLLKYPRAATLGVFSHEGPNAQQLEETSFTSTFFAKGYTEESTPGKNIQPDYQTKGWVHGAEVGYLTTSLCVVESALTLLDEKLRCELPTGVLTPAVAFSKSSLIHRLQKKGLIMQVAP